jgi:hypothetical protein
MKARLNSWVRTYLLRSILALLDRWRCIGLQKDLTIFKVIRCEYWVRGQFESRARDNIRLWVLCQDKGLEGGFSHSEIVANSSALGVAMHGISYKN